MITSFLNPLVVEAFFGRVNVHNNSGRDVCGIYAKPLANNNGYAITSINGEPISKDLNENLLNEKLWPGQRSILYFSNSGSYTISIFDCFDQMIWNRVIVVDEEETRSISLSPTTGLGNTFEIYNNTDEEICYLRSRSVAGEDFSLDLLGIGNSLHPHNAFAVSDLHLVDDTENIYIEVSNCNAETIDSMEIPLEKLSGSTWSITKDSLNSPLRLTIDYNRGEPLCELYVWPKGSTDQGSNLINNTPLEDEVENRDSARQLIQGRNYIVSNVIADESYSIKLVRCNGTIIISSANFRESSMVLALD